MRQPRRAVRSLCISAGLALALAVGASGQPAGGGSGAAGGGPIVVGVRSSEHPDRPLQAGLGERVTVTVQGLGAALDQVPNGCAGLILFLDGIPIQGTPPESCNPATGTVRFPLDRTTDSDAAWHALLGSPNAFTRTIRLSVGPDGNISWLTKIDKFELEVLPQPEFVIYLVLLAIAFAILFRVARRTALLRDPHAAPPAGALAPYSLSRFQLAFWTFLVIAAYVFIWMITEELDTVTGSVLTLLGIGSGTALGASVIAQGKQHPESPAGAAAPAAAAATTDSSPAEPPAASDPAVPRAVASKGFLRDVLNGPQGLSLYRFQMLGWTLVLGVIFVSEVYDRLSMPDFSPSLLALMGISSATYLGAKIPEE